MLTKLFTSNQLIKVAFAYCRILTATSIMKITSLTRNNVKLIPIVEKILKIYHEYQWKKLNPIYLFSLKIHIEEKGHPTLIDLSNNII